MFSWLKVAVIKLADAVNKVTDPWVPFTRNTMPAAGTLKDKADAFEADFISRFFDSSTSFFQYMIPWNTGDQSLWHGIASTMFAIRNQVVKDGKMLDACAAGLAKHQPNGFLMRGKVGDKIEWSTSNDQASGHLAGLYFTGQKDLAKQWAAQIIDHKYAMTEPDGTVTKFGQLENGILTDPLRLTLLLAILKYAGEDAHYKKLLSRYGNLVEFPKVSLNTIPKWGTIGKTYDTHRAAIHLSILADLDPLCGWYRDGLSRMLPDAVKEGNIWVVLLCLRQSLDHVNGESVVPTIKKVLAEFDVKARLQGNIERINSTNASYWEPLGVKFKNWGGEILATQPLPRWTCGSQDFYFQRNLRSVDNWAGNKTADTFHPGLDFLLCYWLARALGFVGENE